MPGVCPRCHRDVYFAEEKLAVGKVWHIFCFTCRNCHKLLDSCTVTTHDGELFCRTCYTRLFLPIGRGALIPLIVSETFSDSQSDCSRGCSVCSQKRYRLREGGNGLDSISRMQNEPMHTSVPVKRERQRGYDIWRANDPDRCVREEEEENGDVDGEVCTNETGCSSYESAEDTVSPLETDRLRGGSDSDGCCCAKDIQNKSDKCCHGKIVENKSNDKCCCDNSRMMDSDKDGPCCTNIKQERRSRRESCTSCEPSPARCSSPPEMTSCADRCSCCLVTSCRLNSDKPTRCWKSCGGEVQGCGSGGCCGGGCRGGCGRSGQTCSPSKTCGTAPCRQRPVSGGSACSRIAQPAFCRPTTSTRRPSSSNCRRPCSPYPRQRSSCCQQDDQNSSCCQSKASSGCECFGGGLDCQRCGKKVYQAEMQIASGNPYHNICFSCFCCRKPLEPLNYQENCGEIYCKQCYVRNFGPQGYGYGIGAGVLQTPL